MADPISIKDSDRRLTELLTLIMCVCVCIKLLPEAVHLVNVKATD